jgi:general secretion pathway protein D
MKTFTALLLVILLLFGTWLLAQRPPPGPAEFFSTNAAATSPATSTNTFMTSTNQADPMLNAFRQALTNAPGGVSNQAVTASPVSPTFVLGTNARPRTATAATNTATGVTFPQSSAPQSPPGPGLAAAPAIGLSPSQTSPGLTNAAAPGTPVTLASPVSIPSPQVPLGVTPDIAAKPEQERKIPAALLNVQLMPLDQFLEIYAEISGRTILRPFQLSGVQGFTLKAQNELTVSEAIYAMDAVLALNQIAMIPVGSKFVKAVPAQIAAAEGAELAKLSSGNFTETEQFVTQLIAVKTVKPSELAQLLASFSKTPNGITAFDNNQTIVLRDYASNVKRMLEVIEKIDVEHESDYKLEVIPIKYGKVVDLYSTMSSLVSGQGGAGFGGAATTGRTGSRLGQGSLGRGGQLGQQGYRQPGQPLQPQQATPAAPGAAQNSFQNRLQQIVSRAAQGEVEILQDARIVPDERSNTLLIFANKRDIAMITNIVSKVDVLLAQVLIEAVIMEVQLRDSHTLGVSMLQNPKRFGQDFTGAGGINNGQGFLNNITNLSAGLPSGFSYFGKVGNDLDLAINAIADNSTVNVISRPRIQTSHAIPGVFVVADNLPFISGSYQNYYGGIGGTANQSIVERIDVGISLSVTPYITPEGLVVMEIQQEASQKGGDVIIDGNPNPIVNKRTAEATLTVKDGQSIMMGGFITDRKSNSKSGVPVLKDIPVLGALFRSKTKSNDRSELIVLLKATVLPSPEKAAELATRERSELPGIRDAEKQVQEDTQKRLQKSKKSTDPKSSKR